MNKNFIGKQALEANKSNKRMVQIKLENPERIIFGGEPIKFKVI